MTLLACQIFSTIAQEGSFARTAERLHLTPSAISHAVSGMETECGFPLFTRTKTGVTMTAAAESLLPAIRRVLASNESLDQSIAQINGLHKGVLRLGVFNSACVVWLPQLVPAFEDTYPGIEVQVYQGSYADIAAWLKSGTVELGFLSDSCAQDLDFEPLYTDPLICIAPLGFTTRRAGHVMAEELRGQPFVSQRSDTDADIQNYLKRNDLQMRTACYVIDDESMVGMVACGQGWRSCRSCCSPAGIRRPACRFWHWSRRLCAASALPALIRTACRPPRGNLHGEPAISPQPCRFPLFKP